jgi:hypothetical protein
MKRIFTIAAALLMTVNLLAQAPEKMSYQAVVRNASNSLITSQALGMQISILQGGAAGTAVYVETQSPTTNANGLVSLEIGTGTLVSGNFTTIDWANDTFFIKTETDPTGGTSYTITGTSQLMSVPYALYAKTSGSSTPGPQGSTGAAGTNGTNGTNGIDGAAGATGTNGTNGIDGATGATGAAGTNGTNGIDGAAGPQGTAGNSGAGGGAGPFHLGKDTLGGIVYYIYIGSNGNQHGLIVNKTESTAVWQASGTLTNANRTEDGTFNTALMTSSAAATYVIGLGAGWYLPSIYELGLLYSNGFSANKALRAGSFTLLSTTASYWSSTEYNTASAFYFYFYNGIALSATKDIAFSARAVRAF